MAPRASPQLGLFKRFCSDSASSSSSAGAGAPQPPAACRASERERTLAGKIHIDMLSAHLSHQKRMAQHTPTNTNVKRVHFLLLRPPGNSF
eukprot:scaffold30032_cov138-Isochrysis_galbana.AAC.2